MLKLKSCTVFAAALMSAQVAWSEEVRVYNWAEYIDEDLLTKFEEETGYDLVYDVFDSNEVLETKLLAGGSGYDLVVPSATFLQRQIAAGVFQPLDKSKLPNAEHLWNVIQERTAKYDPENSYSVTYMWGTTGIGVNLPKVQEILGADAPVDSLDLVFDPKYMEKLAECGVYFLDAPGEIIPAALNYLGEDPDSQDPEVIKKTEPLLSAVRPYVRKFNSSEYISALANGDICAVFGWSGDILQSRDRAAEADNGVEIVYHPVKQGSLMWFDQMAIPADAKNPEGAHAFINFIIDPENISAASNFVYFANGVDPKTQSLNEDVIGDTAIYPDEETLNNLYTTTPWPPKTQRAATRLWTKVKSGT
ncbi:polyamine ABC transporter substrate-binding protein [Roseibium sp. SCP14]|uniref:polyamine ABC transporter substrate-binding protein n=1 Tax=Roseibium sp. SCP14 TaxID=3141375 RepID=UPI003339EC3D